VAGAGTFAAPFYSPKGKNCVFSVFLPAESGVFFFRF